MSGVKGMKHKVKGHRYKQEELEAMCCNYLRDNFHKLSEVNKIKVSLFVEQIIVTGEHEKFASALISPNFAYFKDWCTSKNIPFENNEDLTQLQQVLTVFNDGMCSKILQHRHTLPIIILATKSSRTGR